MDQNIIRGKAAIALSTGAYTGTLSVADTAYVDGGIYLIKPNANSTEAATLNLNGIGAKAIYKPGQIKVNLSDLKASKWYQVIYNSTSGAFDINLQKTIIAEYDFDVHGGTIGDINLIANIPIGTVLKTRLATIEPTTALSSAGNAKVSWGFGTGGYEEWIDVTRPYDDRAYNGSSNAQNSLRMITYGSFVITGGGAGTIDTVTIAGVNLLNGTVAFNTSLTQTAKDVCKNINSNSNNVIRAESSGTTIFLKGVLNDKHRTSGVTSAVSATATTMTVGSFSDIVFDGGWDGIRLTVAKPLCLTISGADLTGGKIRLYIPYEVA